MHEGYLDELRHQLRLCCPAISPTLPCKAAPSWRIVLGAYFQVYFQLYMPLTLLLLETGRAWYIFQSKQAEKEDKLTFKYYFNSLLKW